MDQHCEKIYYVYAWYYKNTGKVFYIGKGKNNRCFETKVGRNNYFKNIVNKNDVDVKILYDNLSNEESLNIEKSLIKEYWAKGECCANFHEGGLGGYTGKYNDPNRSKKLSEFAKTRIGKLNPNYGHRWTKEQREKLSRKNKGVNRMTPEHLAKIIKANTGKIVSQETRDKLSKLSKGRKFSDEVKFNNFIS